MNRRQFITKASVLPGLAILPFPALTKAAVAEDPLWSGLPLPLDSFPASPELRVLRLQGDIRVGRELLIDVKHRCLRLRRVGSLAEPGTKVSLGVVYLHILERTMTAVSEAPIMQAITPSYFRFMDGWGFDGDSSRNLVADAAWDERGRSFAHIVVVGAMPSNEPLGFMAGHREVLPEHTTGAGSYPIEWCGDSQITAFLPMRGAPTKGPRLSHFSHQLSECVNPGSVHMPLALYTKLALPENLVEVRERGLFG